MSAALGYVFMLCSVLFRGTYGVGYKAIAGSPPAWVFNRWILLFAAVTYSAFGPFCNVLAGHPHHCSVNFSPYGFVSGLSNTCAMLVAFEAIRRVGVAMSQVIAASVGILVGLMWGVLLFEQHVQSPGLLVGGMAVALSGVTCVGYEAAVARWLAANALAPCADWVCVRWLTRSFGSTGRGTEPPASHSPHGSPLSAGRAAELLDALLLGDGAGGGPVVAQPTVGANGDVDVASSAAEIMPMSVHGLGGGSVTVEMTNSTGNHGDATTAARVASVQLGRSALARSGRTLGSTARVPHIQHGQASSSAATPKATFRWLLLGYLLSGAFGFLTATTLMPEHYAASNQQSIGYLPSLGLGVFVAWAAFLCIDFAAHGWQWASRGRLEPLCSSFMWPPAATTPRGRCWFVTGAAWSGACIGLTLIFFLLGIQHAGYALSACLLQFSLIVSSLWGLLWFREVDTPLRVAVFVLGALAVVAGGAMLSFVFA